MKRFVIVAVIAACLLSAMAISATATNTQTATITLCPGENWVAAPLVPFNPSTTALFAGFTGNITRFDSPEQRTISSDQADFGGILLGDGYKITNPSQSTLSFSYEGVPDGVPDYSGNMTDMWISLPGNCIDNLDAGGMHWVGQPYNHKTLISDMYMTDGSQALSIQESITAGWIGSLWRGFDNQTQKTFTVGLSTYGADENYFRAGSMYEIETHRDNLALIIGATPDVPEPSSIVTLIFGVGAMAGTLMRKRK